MRYITVSAKVEEWLYEKLKSYNIAISRVIKKALEEEVKRREEEEVRKALAEVQEVLRKLKPEDIVEAIRSGREGR